MHMTRVEIIPDGTLKEGSVLWDDCQSPPQIQQSNRRNIEAIDPVTRQSRLSETLTQ